MFSNNIFSEITGFNGNVKRDSASVLTRRTIKEGFESGNIGNGVSKVGIDVVSRFRKTSAAKTNAKCVCIYGDSAGPVKHQDKVKKGKK